MNVVPTPENVSALTSLGAYRTTIESQHLNMYNVLCIINFCSAVLLTFEMIQRASSLTSQRHQKPSSLQTPVPALQEAP